MARANRSTTPSSGESAGPASRHGSLNERHLTGDVRKDRAANSDRAFSRTSNHRSSLPSTPLQEYSQPPSQHASSSWNGRTVASTRSQQGSTQQLTPQGSTHRRQSIVSSAAHHGSSAAQHDQGVRASIDGEDGSVRSPLMQSPPSQHASSASWNGRTTSSTRGSAQHDQGATHHDQNALQRSTPAMQSPPGAGQRRPSLLQPIGEPTTTPAMRQESPVEP